MTAGGQVVQRNGNGGAKRIKWLAAGPKVVEGVTELAGAALGNLVRVTAGHIQLGQPLVFVILKIDARPLEIEAAFEQVGPLAQALAPALLQIQGCRERDERFAGFQPGVVQDAVPGRDERLQHILLAVERGDCRDQIGLARRSLGFGLLFIEPGKGADFHALLILGQEPLRQLQSFLRHLHVFKVENQLVVGLLHCGQDAHNLLAQVQVGVFDTVLGDPDVVTSGVDKEVLEQRLREGDASGTSGLVGGTAANGAVGFAGIARQVVG